MTDCASLADPKVKGTPTLLYLPSELFPPPLVAALRAKCNVRIEMLPQRITRFGEIRPTDTPTPGLLYLPNPYVKFTHTVEANFERDHTIYEKYNVVTGSSDVQVSAGYKTNVVGFGWTNAVYLEMLHLLDSPVTTAVRRKSGYATSPESADAGNSATAILTNAAHLVGLRVCHPRDRQIAL